MRSPLFLLVACVVLSSGCSAGAAATRAQVRPSAHRPHVLAARQSAAAEYMPGTIRAILLKPGSPPGVISIPAGTLVSVADIGTRAATSDGVVYGLADQGTDLGEVWPAISTDSGKRWRIDGPLFFFFFFYAAAADGPAGTDSIGARGGGMAWAWGWGGNFVKVTTDRGRHWWAADFPAGVWRDGQLQVRALGNPTANGRFQSFLYSSPDDGRTWILHGRLGNVSALTGGSRSWLEFGVFAPALARRPAVLRTGRTAPADRVGGPRPVPPRGPTTCGIATL